MNFHKTFLSFLIVSIPGLLSAQSDAGAADFYAKYQIEIVLGVAAVVSVMALIALVTALYALRTMARINSASAEDGSLISVRPGEEGIGFWRRFWNRINASVPVAQEDTVLTGHDYDGIRELDNQLPPWWVGGFYVTIIFGVIYLLNYHVFKTGKLQEDEYVAEMQKADAEVKAYLATLDNQIDETNVTRLEDQADLSAGMDIFKSKCSPCHGQEGQGGVGPNFTDQYWLHGGDIKDIFKTIKYGVPSKGMISWESQLIPKQIQQVASYVYSLEGTNPPNPKEPQGDLYVREGSQPAADASAVEGATESADSTTTVADSTAVVEAGA